MFGNCFTGFTLKKLTVKLNSALIDKIKKIYKWIKYMLKHVEGFFA